MPTKYNFFLPIYAAALSHRLMFVDLFAIVTKKKFLTEKMKKKEDFDYTK